MDGLKEREDSIGYPDVAITSSPNFQVLCFQIIVIRGGTNCGTVIVFCSSGYSGYRLHQVIGGRCHYSEHYETT
ncbi:unnamed protein product [Allacma fusca]|uniref:Uncharacterized protein n=1 Tax=Allacma fusca TaxID=39272 RepID=A0A8J2MDF4_9HEXA|nr:unnamed protein product [Allacma fusca]